MSKQATPITPVLCHTFLKSVSEQKIKSLDPDKTCKVCLTAKPQEEFHKKRLSKMGALKRDSRCRTCISKLKHQSYRKKSKVKKGSETRKYAQASQNTGPQWEIQEHPASQSGVDGSRLIRLLSELVWEGIEKDQ